MPTNFVRWCFIISTAAVSLTLAVQAQAPMTQPHDKTVWQGVYTAAQAQRGQTQYDAHCKGCHQAGAQSVNPESRLKGPEFLEKWREDNLDSFFDLVKATMPKRDPGSLSDEIYTDIVTYLLRENGFPAGKDELTATRLQTVRVEGKDGPKPLNSGALVHVIGCLSNSSPDVWVLNAASEPVRTRSLDSLSEPERDFAATQQLGPNTFRIQNADYLTIIRKMDLNTFRGQKVSLKGYLVRQSNRNRIDVTALNQIGDRCVQ